ncbi:MAG: hypothetical protein BroJett011_33760 [Chloroflexota bacterium]|nr:MAG: hypothetical protein BroJett011_33760 [Chloroflexota bacterium]
MIVKPFIAQQQEFIVLNNSFFDYVMPDLSPNAWKVLCLIVRKTKGWHKEADRIPYSQIKEGTGLKRPEAIKAALEELISKGYIKAQRSSHKWTATLYELNTDFEMNVNEPFDEFLLVTNRDQTNRPLVTNRDQQLVTNRDQHPVTNRDYQNNNKRTENTHAADAASESLMNLFLTLTGLAAPSKKKERDIWDTTLREIEAEFGPATPGLIQAAIEKLYAGDRIISSPTSLLKTMRGLQASGNHKNSSRPKSNLTPEQQAAYQAIEEAKRQQLTQSTNGEVTAQRTQELERILS